jgi:N-acetylmuramoyl-L-alanine amidase
MTKQLALPLILSLFIFALLGIYGKAEAASLEKGTRGPEVRDVQSRLSSQGYFSIVPTGYFGIITEKAVKRFQRKHGLHADGVIGARTWKQLKKKSTKETDLDRLARIIHAEARGESFKGKVAVGAVVLNRLKAEGFPKTVEGVIHQPLAFTAVADNQYSLTPNREAYRAARAALRGEDPTRNALYYFNPKIATSSWILTRGQTVKIGNHIFAQ